MKPTVRERIRWYRWFLSIPSSLDKFYYVHKYDRYSHQIMVDRHIAKEPCPRMRHGKWVLAESNLQGESK